MNFALFNANFWQQDTLCIAQALLGHYLVVQGEPFIICETEAYTQNDPACHAYNPDGLKPIKGRAAMLYKTAGTAYTYLIYGMYHCLNVVTEPEGQAGAVLFRGLYDKTQVLSGPGKLCRQLGITVANSNGHNLREANPWLYLAQNPLQLPLPIHCGPRIGIRHATDWPWRFWITPDSA